jgi:hypothetical protein
MTSPDAARPRSTQYDRPLPRSIDEHFAKLRRQFGGASSHGGRISAKDVSRIDGCSETMATQRMRAGEYGPVEKLSGCSYCTIEGYLAYLRRHIQIPEVRSL